MNPMIILEEAARLVKDRLVPGYEALTLERVMMDLFFIGVKLSKTAFSSREPLKAAVAIATLKALSAACWERGLTDDCRIQLNADALRFGCRLIVRWRSSAPLSPSRGN
jgi:hypothetical protein